MDADFWHERWQKGEIGFHQAQGNPLMQHFWPQMKAPPGATVLVPLCGKSPDLLWLRSRGHRVVGIELSDIAVEAFFAEHEVQYERSAWSGGARYQADGLEIIQGDFFALPEGEFSEIEWVYDRAAVIALPSQLRTRYAEHLLALCPALGGMLIIALDYEPDPQERPPFSVTEDELRRLYGDEFRIECWFREDALADNPNLQKRGLTALHEAVYALERK